MTERQSERSALYVDTHKSGHVCLQFSLQCYTGRLTELTSDQHDANNLERNGVRRHRASFSTSHGNGFIREMFEGVFAQKNEIQQ